MFRICKWFDLCMDPMHMRTLTAQLWPALIAVAAQFQRADLQCLLLLPVSIAHGMLNWSSGGGFAVPCKASMRSALCNFVPQHTD